MPHDPNSALRVYICCTRADTGFATELLTCLKTYGFDPFFSLEDPNLPQPPKEIVDDQISDSDTVLFILTPDALNDARATGELETAYLQGKRIYLIPIKQISASEAPDALLELPFISFHSNTSFASNLDTLVNKLNANREWIQEHTRLHRLASNWQKNRKSRSLLLFGRELDAASQWRKNKPENALRITSLQDSFIAASLETFHNSAARRKSGAPSLLKTFLTAASIFVMAFLGIQWHSSEKENTRLIGELENTNKTKTHLEAVQTRLYADVRLAPTPGTSELLTRIPGWYPRTTSHLGSIARIQLFNSNNLSDEYTGLILSGELLGEAYKDKAYILTPTFNRSDASQLIASSEPENSNIHNAVANQEFQIIAAENSEQILTAVVDSSPARDYPVNLPALYGDTEFLAHGTLWQSQIKNHDQAAFSLHEITSPLPPGGRPLSFSDIDCQKFSRIKSLGRQQNINASKMLDPIGIITLAPKLENVSNETRASKLGHATLATSRLSSEDQLSYITYEKDVILPETGSAVFNLVTGKIMALHIGSTASTDGPFEGVSLVSLLNEVRADLSVPTSNLNSVCESE